MATTAGFTRLTSAGRLSCADTREVSKRTSARGTKRGNLRFFMSSTLENGRLRSVTGIDGQGNLAVVKRVMRLAGACRETSKRARCALQCPTYYRNISLKWKFFVRSVTEKKAAHAERPLQPMVDLVTERSESWPLPAPPAGCPRLLPSLPAVQSPATWFRI